MLYRRTDQGGRLGSCPGCFGGEQRRRGASRCLSSAGASPHGRAAQCERSRGRGPGRVYAGAEHRHKFDGGDVRAWLHHRASARLQRAARRRRCSLRSRCKQRGESRTRPLMASQLERSKSALVSTLDGYTNDETARCSAPTGNSSRLGRRRSARASLGGKHD